MELKDGVPCEHKGCLHHVTHPCEGCGRIAGVKVPDAKLLIVGNGGDRRMGLAAALATAVVMPYYLNGAPFREPYSRQQSEPPV